MTRHGLFTKEQLSEPLGLSSDTLDSYIAGGLLHPIHLEDGDFYTSSDFVILEVIQKGRGMGFSLDEIKLLIVDAQQSKGRQG